MPSLSIQVPFPVFYDREGRPLSNGYVWVGSPNLDPQTNPIPVYFDSALTQLAAQPLRTINGYVSKSGSPSQLYVDGVSFSVLVQDKNGTTVYQFPDGTGISPNAEGVIYNPPFVDSVATNVELALSRIPSILDFGASPSATTAQNAAAIQAAFSSGVKYLTVPDAIFDCGSAVLSIDHDDLTIVGLGTVTVDKSTNSFISGPVIKATIASNGFDGISIQNVGIDTKQPALTEGLVIVNCSDVSLDGVITIGSSTNNHCILVENVVSATANNITTYDGIQGFAIKAINFAVNNVTSYDTSTYGFTARYSPGAPCRDGLITNINCQTNLKARSGGFVLMNDQMGAAMSDIIISSVNVSTCTSGIYVLNGGNTTKATRIKFSGVNLRDINGFAVQTFGDVDDISIDGIEITDCAGTIYTNVATGVTRLTISNLKQKNSGTARISGSGHIFSNWEKSGGGGFFGENTSSDLQYYNMDARVIPFVNVTDASGTGTINRIVQYPNDVFIPANSLLYATRLSSNRVVTIADTLNLNDERLIVNMPNADDSTVEVSIMYLGLPTRACAKYIVTGGVVTLISGSTASATFFEVVLVGTEVRFKYKWAVTGDIYVDAVYTMFARDV